MSCDKDVGLVETPYTPYKKGEVPNPARVGATARGDKHPRHHKTGTSLHANERQLAEHCQEFCPTQNGPMEAVRNLNENDKSKWRQLKQECNAADFWKECCQSYQQRETARSPRGGAEELWTSCCESLRR